jgi:hypothetical protein
LQDIKNEGIMKLAARIIDVNNRFWIIVILVAIGAYSIGSKLNSQPNNKVATSPISTPKITTISKKQCADAANTTINRIIKEAASNQQPAISTGIQSMVTYRLIKSTYSNQINSCVALFGIYQGKNNTGEMIIDSLNGKALAQYDYFHCRYDFIPNKDGNLFQIDYNNGNVTNFDDDNHCSNTTVADYDNYKELIGL